MRRANDGETSSTSGSRAASVDAARLLAAAGVTWVHCLVGTSLETWHGIGRYGTSFFAVVVVYFVFRGVNVSGHCDYGQYVLGRARRLYVPFVAWNVIYVGGRELRYLAGFGPQVELHWYDLLIGAGAQFWFIPFALLLCAGTFLLARFLSTRWQWQRPVAAVSLVLGIAIALLPHYRFEWMGHFGYLYERSFQVMPAALWGVTLSTFYFMDGRVQRVPPVAAVLGLVMFVAALASYFQFGYTSLAKNLAGLGLMFVAFLPARGDAMRWVGRLGKYSFGIFLIHPCYRSILANFVHWDRLPASPEVAVLLLFAAVMVLSLVTTRLLFATPYTRWLVR